MVKSCIYCKIQLDDNSVVDVCKRCGIGVWGEKMFNAIVSNMENAREVGDLYQGSVSETLAKKAQAKSFESSEEKFEEPKKVKPTVADIPPLVESEMFSLQGVETLGPDSESELNPVEELKFY